MQGRLETALHTVFRQEIATTGSGRTDKGVHARGQVVHGDLERVPDGLAARRRLAELLDDLPEARRRLDHAVGDHITIWGVHQVPGTFDARFSARARHYRYRIVDAPAIDPLTSVDAWHVRGALRLRPMQQAAKLLIGENDFASFCRNRQKKTTWRRLTHATVSRVAPGEIHVKFRGNAFCHQQVRAMVGCLVEVGHGWREPQWIREVLEARDRSLAAAVAPSQGLVLEQVRFVRPFPASPLVSGPVSSSPASSDDRRA